MHSRKTSILEKTIEHQKVVKLHTPSGNLELQGFTAMFSYFSSSDAGGAIDNDKSDGGVTAAGTSLTENSNISDDESGDNNLIAPLDAVVKETPSVNNASSAHYPSMPIRNTSWNQAHDLYCTKYGTLKATIRQVLSENCEENQEIPWELPSRDDDNVLIEAKEVADFLQTKRGKSTVNNATTPLKSSTSSWFMSPLKVVSAVASIMRDPDDNIDEWVQDGDDAFIDDEDTYGAEPSSSPSSSAVLGLNTPIINLDRTENAIRLLEKKISHVAPDEPLVLGLSEWNSWADSSLSEQNTNNNFCSSVDDNKVLLQVLVGLNRARIIERENCEPKGLDVVVLSSTDMKIDSDNSIPENLRIPISLWDIQKAEEKIEQKLQEWSEQVAECTKKALEYKRRNQIKIAGTQLAKRRLIQKRIDSDSRLQIQLLQTKNAIESAQSNRSTIDLMADSAKLLRQLREQTPLEEVGETIDDLQSELDGLQDINESLAVLGNDMGTDEDLLKELQNLSINDDIPVSAATISTPTEDTTESKIEKPGVSEEIPSHSSCASKKTPELA